MIITKAYKIYFLLAWSFCISVCHAQQFTETLESIVTVPTVLNIEVTNNASSPVNFTSTSNFSNGITIANFATVKIKSNKLWTFSAATATPHFTPSGPYASPRMPSSVLSIRSGTQTQYQELTTTNKSLGTGGRGDAAASGNTFNLDLYANPGYDYGPGIYSITINYILTAQ